MVHVHLDERARHNVLLAIKDNSGDRVAALLAGDERPRYHLQPTVDADEEIATTLGCRFRL